MQSLKIKLSKQNYFKNSTIKKGENCFAVSACKYNSVCGYFVKRKKKNEWFPTLSRLYYTFIILWWVSEERTNFQNQNSDL